jgi:UDP-N-acetylmuramoyl-tripeptide--D-alanyl-D-alanine ligase
VPAALVPDTLTALGHLAAAHRETLAARIVAITGSNGKTTTKEMLHSILSLVGPTAKSPASFNNAVGVPLTLFGVTGEHRFAVVELGANAPGEIEELAAIARPDIGVITNISEAHLAGFGSIEGVARAKSELLGGIRHGGVAVLNRSDYWLRRAADRFAGKIVWFGNHDGHVKATEVTPGDEHVRFTLRGRRVRLPVCGRHNVSNALAAAAVALEWGVEIDTVVRGLETYTPPPMRMQETPGRVTLVNDAYNANPGSMAAALSELGRRRVKGRKVFVCGDMLEMGPRSAELHATVGREAHEDGVHLLCAIGAMAGAVAQGAREAGMADERIRQWPDVAAAVRELPDLLCEGDLVWLKGSRKIGLEALAGAVRERADALQASL